MAARRTRTLIKLCSITVVAVSLLVSCGGSDGGADPDGTGIGSGTTTATTSATTSASTSTTTDGSRNVIAWILSLGAGSPPGPASDYMLAYDALLARDCDVALAEARSPQVQSVIEAAATACLAALNGDPALWAFAEERRAALTDADLSCLDAGVYALLGRLLDEHAENPDLTFDFEAGQAEGAPPCPAGIGLQPQRGQAGDVVTITGENLRFVKGVIVAFGPGEATCAPDNCFEVAGGSPTFTMPEPPEGVMSARVIVFADPAQWQMGAATFGYDLPTTSATTTSTSPEETTASTNTETTGQP